MGITIYSIDSLGKGKMTEDCGSVYLIGTQDAFRCYQKGYQKLITLSRILLFLTFFECPTPRFIVLESGSTSVHYKIL